MWMHRLSLPKQQKHRSSVAPLRLGRGVFVHISLANKTLQIPNTPCHHCDSDDPMPTTFISSCAVHGHFYFHHQRESVCCTTGSQANSVHTESMLTLDLGSWKVDYVQAQGHARPENLLGKGTSKRSVNKGERIITMFVGARTRI